MTVDPTNPWSLPGLLRSALANNDSHHLLYKPAAEKEVQILECDAQNEYNYYRNTQNQSSFININQHVLVPLQLP